MDYEIRSNGESRSFPKGDPFLAGATVTGDVLLYLSGVQLEHDDGRTVILMELDRECLGQHTGEDAGTEGSNVLGFARYRNGDDAPSNLVELVRQPNSGQAAIDAARKLFEGAGLTVSLCSDQAGRIIDRLVRPKYNAALRFLDEGLATAEAMDLTCKMGLGYPDGPIERVERGGLSRHYDVSRGMFEITGQPGYAPARRAAVAKAREVRK
jgi:3-hydroxybutyryl-CoA dehydrogenase